jgi:hypothetical protein
MGLPAIYYDVSMKKKKINWLLFAVESTQFILQWNGFPKSTVKDLGRIKIIKHFNSLNVR